MAFQMLTPRLVFGTRRGEYTGDKVRVQFSTKKSRPIVNLFIGRDVANKVGFAMGDTIEFGFDSGQPLIWFLRKGKVGWRLIDINKNGKMYKFTMAVHFPLTQRQMEENNGFVTYKIWQGGLVIELPKCPVEDRQIEYTVL